MLLAVVVGRCRVGLRLLLFNDYILGWGIESEGLWRIAYGFV